MACVKDLFSLESFQYVTLAAGERGIYRTISWPNIAQTPVILNWLAGGDVILMTGVGLNCDAAFLNQIIDQAVRGNAACLMILLSEEHIPDIPDETLVYADKLGFPLLKAPWETQISMIIRDVSALLMGKRFQREEMNRLLEELLFSEAPLFSEPLRLFIKRKLPAPGDYQAVIAEYSAGDGNTSVPSANVALQNSMNLAIRMAKMQFSNVLYLQRTRQQSLVLRLTAEQSRQLPGILNRLCEETRKQYPGISLRVGIGRHYPEPIKLRQSVVEARKALGLCREERPVAGFEQLGIYQLLLEIPDQDMVREFAVERLHPLLVYDLKNRKNLLGTLETYLLTNGNALQTAKQLYIHRNTLHYQLEKIREILGMDFETASERNFLYSLLIIYRMSQH